MPQSQRSITAVLAAEWGRGWWWWAGCDGGYILCTAFFMRHTVQHL